MSGNSVFRSREYAAFRSSVAQHRVLVGSYEWLYFDSGPRAVSTPLVCLPPICGTPDIFFKQMLSLSGTVEIKPFVLKLVFFLTN